MPRPKRNVDRAPQLAAPGRSTSPAGMADDGGAVWTARIRDAKQVLNELRCVLASITSPIKPLEACCPQVRVLNLTSQHPPLFPTRSATPAPSGVMDEKDRVRFTALQRRKLQRFEDIVDDLEDLVTDGSPSSAELEERHELIVSFREDARRLNATFSGGVPSVTEEAEPETVLGKLENAMSRAKSELSAVSSNVNATVTGAAAVASEQIKKQESDQQVRGLSSQELLQLQRSQMRKQDNAMDQLDSLVGKLKMTSNMIREEVDTQAQMVEDLDKDFSHTQSRMKKLRKQGFKLAGDKHGKEKEKMQREEAMEDLKKNLPSHQREMKEQKEQSGSECVVM